MDIGRWKRESKDPPWQEQAVECRARHCACRIDSQIVRGASFVEDVSQSLQTGVGSHGSGVGAVFVLAATLAPTLGIIIQEAREQLFDLLRYHHQAILQRKVVWTVSQSELSPDRIWNLDEARLCLLPGWSKKGEKSSQILPSKSCITATLMMSMDVELRVRLQLIFEGKTERCLPHVPEDLQVAAQGMQLTHSETHWQTAETYVRCVEWLDSQLQTEEGGDRLWLLLVDLASIHTAQETVMEIPDHIKVIYIPAGATILVSAPGRFSIPLLEE